MARLFGEAQAAVLSGVCERIVPGSDGAAAVDYIERAVAGMTAAEEDALHAAIGLLGGNGTTLPGTAAFGLLRRLAIEAYYGDYVLPGHTGPTPHETIGFTPPAAARLRKDWSFLEDAAAAADPFDDEVPAEAEVVVIGSGAGGALIAATLGAAGHDVLVLEAGGWHPAEHHTRFELAARHDLWWPVRAAATDLGPVALIAGRCAGGSTVINTKVAMRASEADLARFGFEIDLTPAYEQVEAALGVRARDDWTPGTRRLATGFAALGASFEPVRSYTDHNCGRCGACLTGCPTNAGRSALNTFLAPALGRGEITLRTRRTVEKLILKDGRVQGVACRDGAIRAKAVVLAAGALGTPQILLRTDGFDDPLAGRGLGLHPARLVYGRFDDPQDLHQAYPITAHCLDHQRDFVIEGGTIQDPVAFAESLVDSGDRPLWGSALAEVAGGYRHWAGLLAMATDDNTGVVELGPRGDVVIGKRFSAAERERIAAAREFSLRALRAAGARELVWSGLSTTHVQGTARMGEDPARSVVGPTGRSHRVAGLYVGDASLIPASLSVNPSLTVMALAGLVAAGLREELSR